MENVVVSDLGDDVSGTLAEQVKSRYEKLETNNLQKNNSRGQEFGAKARHI